jgi:hypothetical protein
MVCIFVCSSDISLASMNDTEGNSPTPYTFSARLMR